MNTDWGFTAAIIFLVPTILGLLVYYSRRPVPDKSALTFRRRFWETQTRAPDRNLGAYLVYVVGPTQRGLGLYVTVRLGGSSKHDPQLRLTDPQGRLTYLGGRWVLIKVYGGRLTPNAVVTAANITTRTTKNF